MEHPTRPQFRWLALIGLGLQLFAYLRDRFGRPLPQDIANAIDLNYYGAVLPLGVIDILGLIWISILIIGGLGLALFQKWSRWLLISSFVLRYLIDPFTGLFVSYGLSITFSNIGYIIFLVPLILSFFSPCSEYFSNPSDLKDRNGFTAFTHLYTPQDPTDLAVVKSILDSGKINYRIDSEGAGSLLEGTFIPQILERRIMVPAHEIRAARQLLRVHGVRC